MMPQFIRPNIHSMAGYAPGEQPRDGAFVKLNTNENPYPPSPHVMEAIRAAVTGDQLRKYPDPTGKRFRQAAGKLHNVDPESILIGNGSDDILTMVTRAFVPEGGLIVSPSPSYSLYPSLAEIQGALFRSVPFTANWKLPEPWPVRNANLTFLPNPNSPSGTVIESASLARLVGQLEGPVLLDEAYVDFAEVNGLHLLAWPNVIISRSLSKSYALAGIRFGYALADPAIIRELHKVKDSYNCDVLSLAAATAAIEDQDYLHSTRDRILATRERMTEGLRQLGFDVTPSETNFVWCRRFDRPIKPIYEELKQRMILVRYMSYQSYGDGLRISVGSDSEVDGLVETLKKIL